MPSLWILVPIAVYSGAQDLVPLACSAAIATRTGPQAFFIISWYSSGRSRPSLSTARLMTWKFTSMSRTFSTSRIQREVIQHHGHSGSNQKPATSFLAIDQNPLGRRYGQNIRSAQLCAPVPVFPRAV